MSGSNLFSKPKQIILYLFILFTYCPLVRIDKRLSHVLGVMDRTQMFISNQPAADKAM